MFHKSQSAIKADSNRQAIQKLAMRTVRKNKLLRYPLDLTKKKFTPRINSSFSEYDEILTPKVRYRSTSVDRPRRLSDTGAVLTAGNTTDDPCQSLMNIAKKEMSEGSYLQATDKFTQIICMNESVEAVFNRAVCYMSLNKIKEAIVDFLNVIRENTTHSKSAYLYLARCFISNNEHDPAIRYLTQALHRFSRFEEGLLMRAKLFSIKKNWEKARVDFKKYLKYSANDEEALVGLSETYEKLGDRLTALKILTEAPMTPAVLFRKSKLHLSMNHYELAIKTLNFLITKAPGAEAFLLKAETHLKLEQYTEAALSYEQCIMFDSSQAFISNAVCHLGEIKIKEKDYYGAIHTFQRCNKSKLREQRVLEIYADAVINLMKRNYSEGIKAFNKLIKSKEPVIEEYISNCYCYRAYGYLASFAFEKCIQSLNKAAKVIELDKASVYNYELAHALLYANKLDFVKSNQRLDKAKAIFPRKVEPYVYKASFLVYNAYNSEGVTEESLLEANRLIEKVVKMRDPESEYLFYRAIIRYLLGKFAEALDDMKECIEKAEDNIPEHYTLKALCGAALKMHKEAIQDFSISLQLNDKNSLIYSYRGRCGYLVDDTTLAFSDYQLYVSHNESDPEVHTQAAVLLMSAGSYEDAIKALERSLSIKYSLEANYLLAKCFSIQNNISGSIQQLKHILKQSTSVPIQTDLEILQYLNDFSSTSEQFTQGLVYWDKCLQSELGEIFQLKYILWYKAVFELFLGMYSKAIDDFQKILEVLHSKDTKFMTSDETLTLEEENCEVLYNLAICHIFGNKAQSILILEDLSEILNNKHKGQMLLLAGALHLNLENPKAAEKLIKEAFRCDPESVTPFLAKVKVKLLPLNTGSVFAEKFPLVSLELPGQPMIELRPALSLPRISLPSLEFGVENCVKDMIFFKKIQPKPEAPWLNRVKGSIQFTDTIVNVDSEPTEITEREQKTEKEQESLTKHRVNKSSVPLRHYSSEAPVSNAKVIEDHSTPEEIVKRIKELCSKIT